MRQQVATALGLLEDPGALNELLKALKEAASQNLKGQIVLAIARIGDARAVDPMVTLLKDKQGGRPHARPGVRRPGRGGRPRVAAVPLAHQQGHQLPRLDLLRERGAQHPLIAAPHGAPPDDASAAFGCRAVDAGPARRGRPFCGAGPSSGRPVPARSRAGLARPEGKGGSRARPLESAGRRSPCPSVPPGSPPAAATTAPRQMHYARDGRITEEMRFVARARGPRPRAGPRRGRARPHDHPRQREPPRARADGHRHRGAGARSTPTSATRPSLERLEDELEKLRRAREATAPTR